MVSKKKSALRVGIMSLIVIGLFVYFTYRLEGTFWGREYSEIKMAFEFVGQLSPGSPIRLAGVPIGYVESIGFKELPVIDPKTGALKKAPETGELTRQKYVLVTGKIYEDKEFTLRKDSKAKIGQTGIIGEYYIELTFGSGSPLEPGDILWGTGPFSIDDLADEAVGVSQSLQDVLSNLNDIVGDESTKKSLSVALQNAAEFIERLNELAGGEDIKPDELMKNLTEFSEKLNQSADRLNETLDRIDLVVAENQENLRKTFANAAELSENLRYDTMKDFNEAVAQIRDLTQKLNRFVDRNQDNAGETLEHFRGAGEGLNEAMQKLNRILERLEGEGGVAEMFLGSATEAEGLRESVRKGRKIIDRTDSILKSMDFVYEYRFYENDWRPGDDNLWRNDAGVYLDLSDRFGLYLGANDIGRDTELEMLVGYRYDFLTFKGGVIESEAALGLDVQPFSRLVLSAEGVGLTDDDEERLDLYARLQLYKYLHGVFGVEDVCDEAFVNGGLQLRF